jgi:hypothetical protein
VVRLSAEQGSNWVGGGAELRGFAALRLTARLDGVPVQEPEQQDRA